MLKSLLLTLLVLGGPVQAQLAHFCDVMEQAVETCCCGHDEQPAQRDPRSCPEGIAGPCCRTVVSLVVDGSTAAAITPADKTGDQTHDPPPLAPPPKATPAPAHRRGASIARPHAELSGPGTRTYLRTLRLRL